MMKRKDDFGQLAGTLETMRESVCGLLAQVKKEAANIDNVVESMDTNISNLNGEIEDVSATTEQLAASTEETAASAEQINSMTSRLTERQKRLPYVHRTELQKQKKSISGQRRQKKQR